MAVVGKINSVQSVVASIKYARDGRDKNNGEEKCVGATGYGIDWGHTELGAVLDILIKLILSGFLFVFGALLVFSPWFAFNWLLTKLPYKYRKPFDISQYR